MTSISSTPKVDGGFETASDRPGRAIRQAQGKRAKPIWLCWLILLPLAHAIANPIPPSQFKSESLALLMQVVFQLEDYVRKNQLGYVHNEDGFLSSAMFSVESCGRRRDGPERFDPETQIAFGKDLEDLGRQIAQLHIHADLGKKKESEAQLVPVRDALNRLSGYFAEPTRIRAGELAGQYLCPMHPDMIGRRTNQCPKCGYVFSQVRRLIPGGGTNVVANSKVSATIRTSQPLATGTEASAVLSLAKADGSPVFGSDLALSHGAPIHLMLIDATLTDYQHEHPKSGTKPGEFEFRFTPRRPGPYFAWADIRPFPMGLQEYAMTSINGSSAGVADTKVDRTETNRVFADGLVWEVNFDQKELRARKPARGRLRVRGPDGVGRRDLEPFMESFIHFAGFYEDRQTVLHLHPVGGPVLDNSARGGPELEFVLFAPRAGFVRLFAQAKVGGVDKVGAFGLRIGPWDGTEVICSPQ